MTAPVSVGELQRAWTAVAAGEFRANDAGARRRHTCTRWAPAEPVVVVAGATGRVGASTVALAMATSAERRVRVVECAPMQATGLAAATTAELGVTDSGWRQGNRDQILIERATLSYHQVGDLPVPEQTDCELTIVDVGWDLAQLHNTDSWLRVIVETVPLIITTVATVPGLRALDHALQLTGRAGNTWCVVTGPKVKKWPQPLHLATTRAIGTAIAAGRLFTAPFVPSLAITGITGDRLPPPLVAASRPLFDQILITTKGQNDVSN